MTKELNLEPIILLYSEDPCKSDEEGRVKQEECEAEIAALCDEAVLKKLVIMDQIRDM